MSTKESLRGLNIDNKTMEYLTEIVSIMKALELDTLTTTTNYFPTPITYNFDYKNKCLTIEYINEEENIDMENGIVEYDEYPCIDYYQIKGKKLIYKKTEKGEEVHSE